MDANTLVSYFHANGIAVLGVDEHGEQTAIRINRGLSVLHQDGLAQVVIHGDPPRFCPPQRTYLSVVAGVKDELPERGTLPPGPMA